MSQCWCRQTLVSLLACWVCSAGANAAPEAASSGGRSNPECHEYHYDYRDLGKQSNGRLIFDAFDQHQGKIIRHINYESRDIFDESIEAEDNWLYRGLNRIHVNTREEVIATQLLFEPNDKLDVGLIKESERILRSRGYLSSAYIVPERVCGKMIDVRVVTRDSWVTEPEVSFAHEGGHSRSSIGVKDGNFLGSGESISIGYAKDMERSSIRYEYETPHLFQTRITARIYYAQLSDGQDRALKLEQPFYALSTPWAAGAETQHLTLTNTIRDNDEQINEYGHRVRFQEAYAGIGRQKPSGVTLRGLAGLTSLQDSFYREEKTWQPIPGDRKVRYGWLGFSYQDTVYATYRNLYQIQRTEDVALGTRFDLRLGLGQGERLNQDDNLVRYSAHYENVVGVGDHHVMEVSFDVSGYRVSAQGGFDTGRGQIQLSYNLFQDKKNRWYARGLYERGWNLRQHEELTVGGASGLRGYPIDYQRGSERYLLNLERRYFSDAHIFNLIRVGAAAYLDVGRAWGLERDLKSNQALANVGLGLRLSSSKARIGNILHIDVAAPLIETGNLPDYQFLIKTEGYF